MTPKWSARPDPFPPPPPPRLPKLATPPPPRPAAVPFPSPVPPGPALRPLPPDPIPASPPEPPYPIALPVLELRKKPEGCSDVAIAGALVSFTPGCVGAPPACLTSCWSRRSTPPPPPGSGVGPGSDFAGEMRTDSGATEEPRGAEGSSRTTTRVGTSRAEASGRVTRRAVVVGLTSRTGACADARPGTGSFGSSTSRTRRLGRGVSAAGRSSTRTPTSARWSRPDVAVHPGLCQADHQRSCCVKCLTFRLKEHSVVNSQLMLESEPEANCRSLLSSNPRTSP
jgi:hypothetical protein